MASKSQEDTRRALSDLLREGLEGSRHSLTRIEEKGEEIVRRMADLSEKFVPEKQRRHFDELAVEAGKLFGHVQQSVEEHAKKIVERLNIPTRNDLDDNNKKLRNQVEEVVRIRLEKLRVLTAKEFELMSKQMKRNLDEQMGKGLTRLNIATRDDVDALSMEIRNLRERLPGPAKATSPKPRPSAKKKTVSQP